MKRLIIIILVLAVIGVAFYFGYLKSQSKKGGELRTAGTNQPIHLEYQPAPSGNPGFSISGLGSTLNIKGTLSLEDLISNLFLNDKVTAWNSYYLEVNPDVGNRKYQINLTIPRNEPTINILLGLQKEMGFTTQVSETTMQFYRAIRNDKPITFSVSQSSHSMGQGLPNARYKFTGITFDRLFMQYKFNGIFIENETGITDKFDGEVLIDKNNPDAMKTELQEKAGIDLLPFEKTIKLISIN